MESIQLSDCGAEAPRARHRNQHTEVHVVLSSTRGGAQAPLSRGVTWGGLPLHARRVATVAAAAFLAAGVAGPATASAAEAAPPSSADLVSVIVRELAGTGNGPERAVEAFGGTVGRHLEIINGFTASVP